MALNSKPLVSIGVPVYNGEKYLHECLESIRNQSYDNWECVIVNNRSTDNSLTIAEEMTLLDNRFKVITNNEFVDMTTNFNNTYRYSSKSAKYFKVVCADDWIFPEFLEKMVNLMEENNNVGLCSSYRIDDKTVICDGLDYYNGPVFSGKKILIEQLRNTIDVTGSETTVLYRLDTIKKLRGDSPDLYSYQSYHFDTSLAYELFSVSDLGFIFQVLSYTRRHSETYTSTISYRFQTVLNFREGELFKYKELIPGLKDDYGKARIKYGKFIIKSYLLMQSECLKWHKAHISKERFFSFPELLAIFLRITLLKIFHLRRH